MIPISDLYRDTMKRNVGGVYYPVHYETDTHQVIDASGDRLDTALVAMNTKTDNLVSSRVAKNLLANSWLSSPYLLNQQGQSSYSVENSEGYCVDCWYLVNFNGTATLTVDTDGITLSATGVYDGAIDQRLNFLKLGTYTLSLMKTDGTALSATLEWDGSTTTYQTVNGCTMWLLMSNGYPTARVSVAPSTQISFEHIKLEAGSISTIVYDTNPTP